MRNRRWFGALAFAVVAFLAVIAQGALNPNIQDFEGLDQSSPTALGAEGWLGFANVYNAAGDFAYGYGVFPAPNGGPGFSGIDIGQGGVEQGDQQLVVYSDYNNGDQAFGFSVEANVFQERTIVASNVGSMWTLRFDAKRGNINDNGDSSTANAFIKTLDPNNGFATTNLFTVDTTFLAPVWGSYEISIFIDPALQGQLLQFGFSATATEYISSGVFYDNVSFTRDADDDDSSDSSSGSSSSSSSGSGKSGDEDNRFDDDFEAFDPESNEAVVEFGRPTSSAWDSTVNDPANETVAPVRPTRTKGKPAAAPRR